MAIIKADCVLDAKAQIGECPIWCERTDTLFWVDIRAGTLNRLHPSSGKNLSWAFSEAIGCCALFEDGAVLVALSSGLYAFDPARARKRAVAALGPNEPQTRPNDGRCDRSGRFWVGTMSEHPDKVGNPGRLWKLDQNFLSTPMIDNLRVPNGLAFSPNGAIMYVSDSHVSSKLIWKFDLDPQTGELSNRSVFFDMNGLPGRPDGAAVDEDGCYWTAAVDGWELIRITPRGEIDRRVPVSVAKPTMPAFGGVRFETLFFTSIRPDGVDLSDQPLAGGIFAIDVGVKGLPEPRFAGEVPSCDEVTR